MASTPSIGELWLRLTRLEQEVATGKAAARKGRASSTGDKEGVGRRELLKMAGMAAAASAGAALLTSTSASAADGGNVILGNSGDTLNPNLAEHATEVHLDGTVSPPPGTILLGNDTGFKPSDAAYPAAVAGWGNTRNGIYGYSGSGTGVVGVGGSQGLIAIAGAGANAAGVAAGQGVNATGGGSGPGVYATGGPSNGVGVNALGNGSGAGVVATGGPLGGIGVKATGIFSGAGVVATGGPTNGYGVVAYGSGAVAGVAAIGGATNGPGMQATGGGAGVGIIALGGPNNGLGLYASGGGANGVGLNGSGQGTGIGVVGFGGSTNGTGVQASGGGAGVGVIAMAGGASAPAGVANGQGVNATGSGSSPGVFATGGPTNGNGVQAVATGSGSGVYGTSPSGYGVYGSGVVGGTFAGGRAQISLSVAPTVGPPTSGPHVNGDVWVDSLGTVWICTVAGTPGTFVPLQQGGLGNALFSAVSTQQYTLPNSDGVTWVDLDATTLKLVITPTFKCSAVLSGNCDLWTANATYNQDLGIAISGGAYPTTLGQPEAWKESGGFAGTFSPNAAFVQAVKPLAAATTYTVKLQWKANKPASGATIYAGAGPIPAGSTTFSPTLLTALLIATA